jgi:hypothetical protein
MVIYETKKARNGAEFKIQSSGQKWSLWVKEPKGTAFKKIQSSYDAKFLSQVLHNQKEFRQSKLRSVI